MKYTNRKTSFPENLFREPELPIREEKIMETIRTSMNSLILAQAEESMDMREFLYQQCRFIKKQWWVCQAVLLVILYYLVKTMGGELSIREVLGIGAPLFVILAIPELWRNSSSNAMDIESATMYTLQQVYSARLTLFAGADLLFLTAFCLGSTASHMMNLWEFITQFIVPLNVTCCICLSCLYSKKTDHQAFALTLCLAFAGIWREIIRDDALYQAITVPTWLGLLALSLAYITYCVLHGQRKWQKNLEIKLAST